MGQETRSFVRVGGGTASAKYAEHFYRRIPITKASYETDAGDLLPKPKKIGRVAVGLAEAEKVRIASSDGGTARYEATPLPVIQFRGKLSIGEVPDVPVEAVAENAVVPEASVAEAAKPAATKEADAEVAALTDDAVAPGKDAHGVYHIPVVHKKGRKTLNAYTKHEKETLVPLSNPDGIIGMQRERITDRNPRGTTIKVDARMVDSRSLVSPWVIVVSGLTASIIAVGLVSVTNSVAVTADASGETYSLTPLVELVNLIKMQLTALLVHSF